MSSAYDKVLQRLQAYRQTQKLNQDSMSQIMGVTQSHYSKMETGKIVITGEELKNFDSHGFDVDYLITGENSVCTVLNGYLEQCREETKADFLQLLVWAVHQGARVSGTEKAAQPFDYAKEIEFLRYKAFSTVSDKSIWYKVRKANDLTQNQMADVLDIGVKRYREIEKGRLSVNAELMTALYENLGYPPSMIFYEDVQNISRLNKMWDGFGKGMKEELEEFLKKGLELCNRI